MTKNKIKQKYDAFKIVFYSLVVVWVLSMIYLLLFGFINSLKATNDLMYNVFGLPRQGEQYGWRFINYISIINDFFVSINPVGAAPRKVYIEEMFLNTILYATIMSLFCIATQVMTAYIVSKYKFRGQKLIYTVAIIVMLIPIIGSLPSQVRFAKFFGFDNSIVGVAIMNCKYPGLYFLVFYAAFKGVSWTYSEAAQIDGASHFKIFLQIMMPMISSTIAAVFILYFIQYWNEYQIAMIFLPTKPTISYGLYYITSGPKSSEYSDPTRLSAAFVSCIPVIILFIFFRNKIMGNVTAGGIKG